MKVSGAIQLFRLFLATFFLLLGVFFLAGGLYTAFFLGIFFLLVLFLFIFVFCHPAAPLVEVRKRLS